MSTEKPTCDYCRGRRVFKHKCPGTSSASPAAPPAPVTPTCLCGHAHRKRTPVGAFPCDACACDGYHPVVDATNQCPLCEGTGRLASDALPGICPHGNQLEAECRGCDDDGWNATTKSVAIAMAAAARDISVAQQCEATSEAVEETREAVEETREPASRAQRVYEACLAWVKDSGYCHFCAYTKGECEHDEECPLAGKGKP